MPPEDKVLLVEVETVTRHLNAGLYYDPGEQYEVPANEAERLVARGTATTTGRVVTKAQAKARGNSGGAARAPSHSHFGPWQPWRGDTDR